MAGHPWEITLRQFMARAKSEYGLEARTLKVGVHGLFLTDGVRLMTLPTTDEDDLLEPEVLQNLCLLYGLPLLDFGLDPDFGA
jgi:AMMECR1 domain-containing protein